MSKYTFSLITQHNLWIQIIYKWKSPYAAKLHKGDPSNILAIDNICLLTSKQQQLFMIYNQN